MLDKDNANWLLAEYRRLLIENRTLRALVIDPPISSSSLPLTPAPETALQQFQESILVDVPYPDNTVPETAWLTPGEPARPLR